MIAVRKTSVICYVLSEGKWAHKGQPETKYILLFNFQWGCIQLGLVSSDFFHYHFSKIYA